MNKGVFAFGAGTGIIIVSVVMLFIYSLEYKTSPQVQSDMTYEEIIEIAKDIGMVFDDPTNTNTMEFEEVYEDFQTESLFQDTHDDIFFEDDLSLNDEIVDEVDEYDEDEELEEDIVLAQSDTNNSSVSSSLNVNTQSSNLSNSTNSNMSNSTSLDTQNSGTSLDLTNSSTQNSSNSANLTNSSTQNSSNSSNSTNSSNSSNSTNSSNLSNSTNSNTQNSDVLVDLTNSSTQNSSNSSNAATQSSNTSTNLTTQSSNSSSNSTTSTNSQNSTTTLPNTNIYSDNYSFSNDYDDTEIAIVFVKQGDPATEISQKLVDAGIIEDSEGFLDYVGERNSHHLLRQGEFTIPIDSSYEEVFNILRKDPN